MVINPTIFVFASLCTAAGLWGVHRFTDVCASLEEAVKERKITPEQAASRMRFVKRSGPLLTLAGMVLLLAAVTAESY